MQLKELFHAYKLINEQSTCSVSEVFNGFRRAPTNRRESELFEATIFGKCLEIWSKQKLNITFVNEERTEYKGIDFFLSSSKAPKHHIAFQLVEYKRKYCRIENTDQLAQWIIEKKFHKGDKKISLVISIATKKPFPLDIMALRKKLEESPYHSITLVGPLKTDTNSSTRKLAIIGLSKFNYLTIVDIDNDSLLEYSTNCPYFN